MTIRIRVGVVLAAAVPSVFTGSSASYVFALAVVAAVVLFSRSFIEAGQP